MSEGVRRLSLLIGVLGAGVGGMTAYTLTQVRHSGGCSSAKFFRMSIGLGKVCTAFHVKTEPLR